MTDVTNGQGPAPVELSAAGVEHEDRAGAGADAGGELEHVVFGGGGHDGPGVAQDDPGQPAGLARPGRALDHGVLFEWQPQPVPVLARGRVLTEYADAGAVRRCQKVIERRDRRLRRNAANRPHRSHSSKTVPWPRPGCSRSRSRIRRCRTRWRGSRCAGRNAHLTATKTSAAAAMRMMNFMTRPPSARTCRAGPGQARCRGRFGGPGRGRAARGGRCRGAARPPRRAGGRSARAG